MFWQSSGSVLPEFWNVTKEDTKDFILGGNTLWELPMFVIRSYTAPDIYIDRLNQNIVRTESDGVWTTISTPSLSWDISICYSAWSTADLHINAYSERERTEPITHWSTEKEYYTIPNVHH